jgi:hypothetical protein
LELAPSGEAGNGVAACFGGERVGEVGVEGAALEAAGLVDGEESFDPGRGLLPDDALELAVHTEVDVHSATDLRRRGCLAETAKKVLN